jgi:hypothetical protein
MKIIQRELMSTILSRDGHQYSHPEFLLSFHIEPDGDPGAIYKGFDVTA